MRYIYLFSFICSAVLLISPIQAHSCECKGGLPKLAKTIEKSSLVFLGETLEVTPSPLRQGMLEVTFRVKKIYKQQNIPFKQKQLIVYTPSSVKDCGFRFIKSSDYLVYATGNPAYYQTHSCNRTALLELSQEDLKILEEQFGADDKSQQGF